MLVRNVEITGAGRLDAATLALAAKLSVHHNYTPVADNNSEVPQELTPQVYFQYSQRKICNCSQCALDLNTEHVLPADSSVSIRNTLEATPLEIEKVSEDKPADSSVSIRGTLEATPLELENSL